MSGVTLATNLIWLVVLVGLIVLARRTRTGAAYFAVAIPVVLVVAVVNSTLITALS